MVLMMVSEALVVAEMFFAFGAFCTTMGLSVGSRNLQKSQG